jgi:hypothetical protein
MILTKLADIGELVERHLPAVCPEHERWRHVASQMNRAARGRHQQSGGRVATGLTDQAGAMPALVKVVKCRLADMKACRGIRFMRRSCSVTIR